MFYWVFFLWCIPDWWLGKSHPASLMTLTHSRNQEFLILATSQLTLGANQQAGFISHHQHISAFPCHHLNQIKWRREKQQGQNQWRPLTVFWFQLGLLATLQHLIKYGLNRVKWFRDYLHEAQTATIIPECYHYVGTDEWSKCYVIKCKEMLLHWNKADVAAQFAMKLQVTCYYHWELLLELGSAPAVQ